MKALRSCLLCATLLVVLAPAPDAGNGNIGLFFDAEGSCVTTVGCSQRVTLYVYALLDGASLDGITGAEFGIRIGTDAHVDEGWMFSESFSVDANIVIGKAFDPVDDIPLGHPDYGYTDARGRGVNIAFPTCQVGDGTKVLLETVEIWNIGCDPGELPLLVTRHDKEGNQFFQCPVFALCDDPAFSIVCLGDNLTPCQSRRPPFPAGATCSTGGSAIVNPSVSNAPCPPTAVNSRTWSAMKQLYGG
jgi:hypothetical protein